MTIWPAIAASALVFGQMQNFGNAPDPQETKCSEKMNSQTETVIGQNKRVISQNWLVISIAILALIVSVIALTRSR
jgi:hypothetical protein